MSEHKERRKFIQLVPGAERQFAGWAMFQRSRDAMGVSRLAWTITAVQAMSAAKMQSSTASLSREDPVAGGTISMG